MNAAGDPTPDTHARVGHQLRALGQRYTSSRRRLIDVMLDLARPATLPELAAADPAMATSSIYRNLDVLERAGLVRRLVTSADHTHYELDEPLVDHHHHLICTRCGGIDDIGFDPGLDALVDRTLHATAADRDFMPTHHTIDLHGICARCR